MNSLSKITKDPNFFLVLISTAVYGWFCWFDRNHDMERYYINHDKLKYKLLLYSKYVLMFSIVYNVKAYIFNLLKNIST